MPGSSINKDPRIIGKVNNVSQHVTYYTASPTSNYWTPLTSRVEELDSSHEQTSPHYSSQHKVVSTKSAVPPQPSSNSHVTSIQGDRNSAVFDTGATSGCVKTADKFQSTTQNHTKSSAYLLAKKTAASTQAKLHHNVRKPEKTADMVPELKHNSLIRGCKTSDAKYITVLTPNEVFIYDGDDTHISVSKESILRGWRDTTTGLWRVLLQPNVPHPKSEFIFPNVY